MLGSLLLSKLGPRLERFQASLTISNRIFNTNMDKQQSNLTFYYAFSEIKTRGIRMIFGPHDNVVTALQCITYKNRP